MAGKSKTFDCVEMKNRIQRKLREEWKDLSDEQVRERIHRHLETSDDELARWWRQVRSRQAAQQE